MIAKLWGQYQQNIQNIRALQVQTDVLRTKIEVEVAESFQIDQALMTRWSSCSDSPTGFCFTNPNSKDHWVCLYCGTDLSMPR